MFVVKPMYASVMLIATLEKNIISPKKNLLWYCNLTLILKK